MHHQDVPESDINLISRNISLVMKYLSKRNMYPVLDVFGGESLMSEVGFAAYESILEGIKAGYKMNYIVIPTNMSFLAYKKSKKRVFDLIERFEEQGIHVSLSASVDGKLMESNRPPKSGSVYSDAFYDELFTYAKKSGCGFHPMVYSNGIDRWIENFLWFQDMMAKYELPWWNIYLLEVRNKEWTVENCEGLKKFVEFLVDWSFKKVCSDNDISDTTSDDAKNAYMGFLFGSAHGFNMLASPLCVVGRGMGCSAQSTLMVRASDLKIFPCHRMTRDHFSAGGFKEDSGEITGVYADHPELYITLNSCDRSTWAYCSSCVMKHLCSSGCWGAQLEANGDPVTPIPSVCRMEHAKLLGMLVAYKRIGVLPLIMDVITENKKNTIKMLAKEGYLG